MFKVLLTIIFIRPFISLIAFPHENFFYTTAIFGFLAVWFAVKGVRNNEIKTVWHATAPFIIAVAVSFISAADKNIAVQELYANHYLTGILFLLIIVSLDFAQREKIISCILLSGFVITLGAFHQYLFGFKRFLDYLTLQGIADAPSLAFIAQKRVFFPFATPNTLAGYLAMILPLALTKKKRYWFIIPLSVAFLLTKSLGALFSLLAALTVYLYLKGNLGKKGLVVLLAALLIAGSAVAIRLQTQSKQLRPLFSTSMRVNYLRDTLKVIKKYPLTGAGLGKFDTPRSRYAHNSYLQVWAEMGILGIPALLWLIITVMGSSLRKLKTAAEPEKTYIAGLVAANTAFLAHNLVDFTFFLPEVSIIWWIIMGLQVAEIR